ncbi:MAG: hypothetical protein LBT35_06295 [Tannerella sp.]|jgi:hypothetical protein|nr:hypothetical protein [Tannerella sp.]
MKTIKLFNVMMLTVALSSICSLTKAQEVEVSAGGDLVSSYLWRGIYCGGASIQPTASVALGGLSLTAWGSVGFEEFYTREFDFNLTYGVGGFSVGITDLWFFTGSEKYFKYDARETAHVFEATLGYDFGAASLSVNTVFSGNDYYKANGKRAYSTYIEAGVPFSLGGLDLKAELGLTPFESIYSDKLNVVNLGLSVGKEIRVTDSFAIPAFTKVVFNPYESQCYFIFGITL